MWGRVPSSPDEDDGYTDLITFSFMADQAWTMLRSAAFIDRLMAYAQRSVEGAVTAWTGYGVMETRRTTRLSRSASVYVSLLSFGDRKRVSVTDYRLLKQLFSFDGRHAGSTNAALHPRQEPPREIRTDRWESPGPCVTADVDTVPVGYVRSVQTGASSRKLKRWWRSRAEGRQGHLLVAGRDGRPFRDPWGARRMLQDDPVRIRIDQARESHRFGPWGRWMEGVLWDWRVKWEKDDGVGYPRWRRV